jgi:hypothetical protein
MCCRVGDPHLHFFFTRETSGKELRTRPLRIADVILLITSSLITGVYLQTPVRQRNPAPRSVRPPPALPLTMAAASCAAPTTSFAKAPAPGRLKASPLSLKMLPRRVLPRAASESAMVRGPFRAQYFLIYPFPRFLNNFLYSMDWAPLLAFENICLPPSP